VVSLVWAEANCKVAEQAKEVGSLDSRKASCPIVQVPSRESGLITAEMEGTDGRRPAIRASLQASTLHSVRASQANGKNWEPD
jgi:hypothetical protein